MLVIFQVLFSKMRNMATLNIGKIMSRATLSTKVLQKFGVYKLIDGAYLPYLSIYKFLLPTTTIYSQSESLYFKISVMSCAGLLKDYSAKLSPSFSRNMKEKVEYCKKQCVFEIIRRSWKEFCFQICVKINNPQKILYKILAGQ